MTDCCDKWEQLEARWNGYAESYCSYYPKEWRDFLEIEVATKYSARNMQLKGADRLLIGELIQAQIGILVDSQETPDWEKIGELIDLHRRIVTLNDTRGGKHPISERHPACPDREEWELENGDIVRGNWTYAHKVAKEVGSHCVKRNGKRIRHYWQSWDNEMLDREKRIAELEQKSLADSIVSRTSF